MTPAPALDERLQLGALGPRIVRVAGLIGLAGLVLTVILGFFAGGERFFRSYHFAVMFLLSISLGGLFFTIIHHAARAGWSTSVRRLFEALAGQLSVIWVLFLPILGLVIAGKGYLLFPWMDAAHRDELLLHKAPYLNTGFWLVRAVLFLAIWAWLGRFFFRNSVAQDATGDVELTHRMQRLAPAAAVIYALTQTFASIDWIMSMEAHWFSTMFGVYFFAGSTCALFSTLIIVTYLLQRSGRVETEITLEHYQDMGKFLFGFGVVFWAYIGFSQFMLIWYANIPEETTWYLGRTLGEWKAVSWLLLLGHFAIPFVLLVTKHTKRVKPVIATIAVWMLVMHAVDVYWLVMPQVPGAAIADATTLSALARSLDAADLGFAPHLMDLTALVGLGGLYVAALAWRMRSHALVPLRDPRLGEALAFENM